MGKVERFDRIDIDEDEHEDTARAGMDLPSEMSTLSQRGLGYGSPGRRRFRIFDDHVILFGVAPMP